MFFNKIRNKIRLLHNKQFFNNYLTIALLNCKIYNVISNSYLNYNTIGILNDKIVCIGNEDNIKSLIANNTQIINIKNNIILPGFTDSHCHFLDSGLRLLSVKLRNVKTKNEFKEKLKEYIQNKEHGTWILGGDWNHYNFGGELPTREWIDDIITK